MSEGILIFNLQEDEEEFHCACNGLNWALLVWDIDQLCRNKTKYGELSKETNDALDEIRELISDTRFDEGLKFPA